MNQAHYKEGLPELGPCNGSCSACLEVAAAQPKRRYVEVSRKAMMRMLEQAGFKPFCNRWELGYFRPHAHNPDVLIKVYTSFSFDAAIARPCGKDAIRVVATFESRDKNFPICKMPRVYRTGSEALVIERTLQRMREAYAFVNLWLRTPAHDRKLLKRPGQKEKK